MALLAALGSGVVVAGCLPPPRMELSAASRRASAPGVWWWLPPTRHGGPAVVGVEQRVSPQRVRQWLIDDSGVRSFDYRMNHLADWGPPLPASPMGDDFAVVPSLVRGRFGADHGPGWPGPSLPENEVDGLRDAAGLAAVLGRHWQAGRTDPPAGWAAHDVRQAMEAARVTLGDLLKTAM